jgi:hypothetical protein
LYAPPSVRGIGQAQAPGLLSTTSTQIGSGLLATAGLVTQTAGPIAGAAVAAAGGIAELVGAVSKLFQGCGPTCTEATTIVNQVEPYLQQNNQLYFTNPNRTTGDQANALATVQQIFAMIEQQCGAASLGVAGQNCISDRLGSGMNAGSSSCVFGLTGENEYPPYCSVPYPVGVCWTWVLAYYDPIVNDVPPGGVAAATLSTSASTSTIAGLPTGLVFGIAAILILLMVAEG